MVTETQMTCPICYGQISAETARWCPNCSRPPFDADAYKDRTARTDLPDYAVMANRLRDEKVLMTLHALMGICTEAGEMMDQLKKHLMYGKPLDDVNLMEEGGDLHWYEALLYRAINRSFGEAMAANEAKLRARYPEKFTEEAALNRDLGRERKILEEDRGSG